MNSEYIRDIEFPNIKACIKLNFPGQSMDEIAKRLGGGSDLWGNMMAVNEIPLFKRVYPRDIE